MQVGHIEVKILFWGRLKDLFGHAGESIELPSGALVRDVVAHYQLQLPQTAQWMSSLAIAVNQRYASLDTELHSGDEVALLPPVSGGSSGTAASELPGDKIKTRVQIVRDIIDANKTVSDLKRGEDGAVVVFEGTVRNQTRRRETLYLDYEAYEPMALQEMQSLAAQALDKFQVRNVALVHRLGRLEIGETSVLIVVASAHRAAAFEACRWLIDTLKRTVPIWKKEHFADGAVWADGEPFPDEIARAGSSANSSPSGSPTAGPASK
jgi:MoaE-MoaD fusion protein